MMNEATRLFVARHRNDDVRELALRGYKDSGVDMAFALQQIAGWQTARRKLPSWAAMDGIVFPPHLSMEQCSSEQTARYKARIAGALRTTHSSLLDITGGFGVDFAWMAPLFRESIYVEQNPQLFAISSENLPRFVKNVKCICSDGIEVLRQTGPVGVVFADPARRDQHGGRTFAIGDCTPDVLAHRDLLLERADHVMLKLSPMLDWRKAVSDLGRQFVSQVHIVSTGNECKELLVVMQREADGMDVFCANDDQLLTFSATAPGDATPSYADRAVAGMWLYEPNASIMKAGCFALLTQRYATGQLAPNSHLFVSADEISDFPGRRFLIEAVTTLNRKELRQALAGVTHANISVRNFPLGVAELRRRLKLADGGDTYLFATTLSTGQHVLLLTRRVAKEV